jgi:hypothetical protein
MAVEDVEDGDMCLARRVLRLLMCNIEGGAAGQEEGSSRRYYWS